MSVLYPFMRRGLPYFMVFMLCACGGGGGDDDSGTAGTNDTGALGNSNVPDNVYIATLGPVQEIQAVNSTATGIGVVLVDPATRLMRASLTTAGIATTSASIRLAEAGSFGSIALPLTETPAGNGVWSVQLTLTEDQLTALRNGSFYFNVQSAAFPQGELRGQVVQGLPANGFTNTVDRRSDTNGVTSGGFTNGNIITTNPANPLVPGSTTGTAIGSGGLDTVGTVGTITPRATTPLPGAATQRTALINVLTGAQQIPANASSAVAVGVVIVDATSQSTVASITSIGISGLSAHIHQAPSGANGATVFTLNETATGSGTWSLRLALTESQRIELANGNYYFDMHTAAFADGELRGQIGAGNANGTGNFNIGSPGIDTGGSNSGIVTQDPFIPGSVTGSGNLGAGVPGFGNPSGSGIGSAGTNDFSATNVPTFGNPAGSGIGSGAVLTM